MSNLPMKLTLQLDANIIDSSDGTATTTLQARSKPLMWWNTPVKRAVKKIERKDQNRDTRSRADVRTDVSFVTKTTAPETMLKLG